MPEFDEFGIPIKSKSQPTVDEFGIPIKKKEQSVSKPGGEIKQSSSATPQKAQPKPSASSTQKNDVEIFTGFPGKEKNQYRIVNGQWQRKQPGENWVTVKNSGSIIGLNKQFKKNITPNEKFEGISSKLIDNEEEQVVPYLQRQYGHLGFKFEESGAGDRVKVITDDGRNSSTFYLDNWTDGEDASEALRLKAFLKENMETMERDQYRKVESEIQSLTTKKPSENADLTVDAFSSQKAGLPKDLSLKIEDQLKLKESEKKAVQMNKSRMNSLMTDLAAAKKTGTKADDEFVRARIAETYSKNDLAVQNRYVADGLNDVARSAEYLKNKEKEYAEEVERYVADLEANGGVDTPELEERRASIEGLGIMLDDQRKNIQTAVDQTKFTQKQLDLMAAERFIHQESKGTTGGGVVNQFLKGATNIWRFAGLEKSSQEELVKLLGSDYTEDEYINSEDRTAFESALFSLGRSLGAAAGGVGVGTQASFFADSYYSMMDEIDSNPEFDSVPEGEKQLLGVLYGLTIGKLEKSGFAAMTSTDSKLGKQAANWIIAKTFKNIPKGATIEVIENEIENNLKAYAAKGLINLGTNAIIGEGGTEFTQEIAGIGIKELYNYAKEKELFNTPDDILAASFEAAALGALGGTIMQTPIQAVDILANGLSGKNKLQADIIEKSISDPELKSMLISNIKTNVLNGDLTKEEGEQQISAINESASVFSKLPNNISDIGRAKSFDLLIERSKIEKEISGKDQSLVEPQRQRINEINEQLKTIAQNAVQKQATSEVSVQPETTTGQEVEGGKPEAEPQVVTEEGKEEVEDLTSDPATYSQSLGEAITAMKEEGKGLDLQVSPVSVEDASAIVKDGGNIFMTKDRSAGGYVKRDGYMGGLFKNPKSPLKKIAKAVQQARVEAGGFFMDAYATELEPMYIKNGFRPVARLKFNEEYAPEGWDAENSPLKNKPDVVFFAYDPDGKYNVGDGEYVESYDQAYEMAKNIGSDLKATREAAVLSEAFGPTNVPLSKQVKRAQKAIAKILPDVQIVVHNTEDEYRKATGETDSKQQASRGEYNPTTNTIHINKSKANGRTVAHEVFHAVIIKKVGTDAAATQLTDRMIRAVDKAVKKTGNTELASYLNNFMANYNKNVQSEEKMAELVGYLAENFETLPLPTRNIIKQWIDSLLKRFGIKPMTDNEIVELMNTIAGKVAVGEEITYKKFNGGSKVSKPSDGLTARKQYGNETVKVEVRYFEQERMDELIKSGLVKEVNDLSSINGQRVVTTSPDDMLVGSIYVNGKEVATGNGGIFFVTKFGDVWANSNKGVAKGLASAINESSRANGGKAYLVLVKGTDAKLVSSPQGVTSSLAVTESMLDAGLFSLSDFRAAIRSAVKDAGGTISLSQNGSAKTLKNELDSFFSDVTASTFEKRGNVLKAIIANLAKSESATKNKSEIIKFLNGDTSKGLGVGSTPKSQSLVDLVAKVSAEQLTKGLNTGDIYGVIEINGEVDIFEDQHQSYPYHIKIVDKNGKVSSDKPVLILPKNRKNGREILTSIDGQTSDDLGSGFAGKVGATANMPYGKGIIQDSASPRKQLSPEIQSALTEDGKGNYVFHHYSEKRRDTIKPGSGTNIITGKDEGSALSAVGGLAQYYTMKGQAETGVGNELHTVLVPMDRVYDFYKDPDNLLDEAQKRFEKARPGQAFNPNYQLAFITQVANENGYDMVVAPWRNNEYRAQTTLELTPEAANTQMKDRAVETYNVGDSVEVFGMNATITDVNGPVLTYKGEGVEGQINVDRNPRSIKKSVTTRKQIDNEAQQLSERKQKKDDTLYKIVQKGRELGLSDAGIRKYAIDNGYTDKQISDAIVEYNLTEEGIFVKGEGKAIVDSIKSFKRRMLSARSFLPKSVFKLKEQKDANIAYHLNMVDRNVKDFNRLYKAYKGDKDILLKNFDAYLRGDKNVDLDEDFKIIANSMRNQVDGLSRQIIASGLVEGDQIATIAENLGSYLTRSYAVYERDNWKKEVSKEVLQKAKNYLREQYRPWATEMAQKEGMDIEQLLDERVDAEVDLILTKDDKSMFAKGGKEGSKNLSVLKERMDIPVEIRMLMGEYTDPGLNYAQTVLKLSALAENHKFLTEVRKSGLGKFFYEKNDPRRPKEFNTEIAAKGSETMNPLNGLYTTKEVADAFSKQPSTTSQLMQLYMKVQSFVKWNKTIGSVATHAKNVVGNVGFIWMNSHADLSAISKAYSSVRNDLFNKSNKELRELMDKYIKLGIVKQSAGLGEIRDMFKDANWDDAMAERLSNKDLNFGQKAKRKVLRVKKRAEDWYQAEDDFFKIVAYENESARYSEAMFGKKYKELTDQQKKEVDDVTSEIVKNVYPTYDRIPEAIQLIRRFPFMGNFVSFQAEAYRTMWNTMALAKQELSSDNTEIKKIGAKRLVGATTYVATKSAVIGYLSMAAGTGFTGLMGYLFDDDEERQKEKDIREFIAPWSKNSDLMILEAGNGKIKYIDFSATDPHGGLKKAMNAFFLSDDPIDGLISALGAFIDPFVGEEMTTSAILDLRNNKDKYGKNIFNPEASLFDTGLDITKYIYNVIEPGTISSVRRGIEAEDKTRELTANLTGYRVYDVDVKEQFGFKVRDLSERIKNAKKIYNAAFYNEDASDEKVQKEYNRSQKALDEIYQEMIRIYNSAERLGVNPDDLKVTMSDFGNMSKRDIRSIQAGEIPQLKEKTE